MAYEFPAPGGRVEAARFPIFRASAVGLPKGVRALLAMSDLQGREPNGTLPGKASRLLSEAVVDDLVVLAELCEIPMAGQTRDKRDARSERALLGER